MSYTKVVAWHIEAPGDQFRTLCGLRVRAHPEPGEHRINGWSEWLVEGEPSCESCYRAEARAKKEPHW